MLATLYESKWLNAIAAKYGLDLNDADDVRQAVALKCFAERRACAPGKEWAYLGQVVRTCAADNYRIRKRLRPLAEMPRDDSPVFCTPARGSLDRTAVVDARLDLAVLLERLPAKERDAVRKYRDGLSYREIAATEGVPEGTAKRRVNRGRRALREMAGE